MQVSGTKGRRFNLCYLLCLVTVSELTFDPSSNKVCCIWPIMLQIYYFQPVMCGNEDLIEGLFPCWLNLTKHSGSDHMEQFCETVN